MLFRSSVLGDLVLTPDAKQPFEIKVKEINYIGKVAVDYPLQKKRHSFEFLRDIAHLRPRANTFYAVYRVRSVLSMAIHEFFQKRNFVYFLCCIVFWCWCLVLWSYSQHKHNT